MPQARYRALLLGLAAFTICVWLLRLRFKLWLGTSLPWLNAALVCAAFAVVILELAARPYAGRPRFVRVASRVTALALGIVTLILGPLAIFEVPAPVEIGATAAGRGNLVAYLTSAPLVADFVTIERQQPLLPGLFLFRTEAVIDPAWDPHVTIRNDGTLLIAYTDDRGAQHMSSISP